MRKIVMVSVLALAGMGLTAQAQISAMPETSNAQQQVNDLSRSINAQQRSLQQSQQNQFETNQLRGEIQRQNTMPPLPSVGCQPGALRC